MKCSVDLKLMIGPQGAKHHGALFVLKMGKQELESDMDMGWEYGGQHFVLGSVWMRIDGLNRNTYANFCELNNARECP